MDSRAQRIRTHAAVLAATMILLVACGKEKPAPPPQPKTATTASNVVPEDFTKSNMDAVVVLDDRGAVSRVRVGSKTGSDGLVSEDKTAFKRNEPILVSMWVDKSPGGLQTSAKLFDAKGKELAEERKPMNGARTVTFSFAKTKLKPGEYKVVAFWGGNRAEELDVTVR